MGETLLKTIDVFRCCIFTWDFFPVVLPAFLLAGAIPVFVPPQLVLRYLGQQARPVVSYTSAALSGFIVSMCSCNIVPLAASIYQRGAGVGPAFVFLYAGPAINFVTMVWVFQIVGWRMGLWRALAVPIIALCTGAIMHLVFRREAAARRQQALAAANFAQTETAHPWKLGILFGLLVGILTLGARGLPWPVRLAAVAILATALVIALRRWFTARELKDWMRETGYFLRLVLPLLVPAILLIGLGFRLIPIKWMHENIYTLVGDNSVRSTFIAAAFGSVMYFPILTEIAFTKALLKYGMIGVGPAMAILLNGPGVSLPGALLLCRVFGWKKTLIYELLEMSLGTIAALVFGQLYGEYVCPCQTGQGANPLETAVAVGSLMLIIAVLLFAVARAARQPVVKETEP